VTSDPRVARVVRGYDRAAEQFLDWARRVEGDPRLEWLADLAGRLPDGARVLELGCGAGEPCTRLLCERFRVTGVDASQTQLALARAHAPRAELVHADFLELDVVAASYDAVCSFYVLNHVPRDRLGGLVERIATWLAPGGLFMHAFGATDLPDWEGEWFGVETFFSGFEPPENRALVERAGLEILRDELVTFREPDPEPGEPTFQWILARKGRQ
jgi:cyclopropane fatty-acyl-phospholipid synthase-like methyltransferase